MNKKRLQEIKVFFTCGKGGFPVFDGVAQELITEIERLKAVVKSYHECTVYGESPLKAELTNWLRKRKGGKQ